MDGTQRPTKSASVLESVNHRTTDRTNEIAAASKTKLMGSRSSRMRLHHTRGPRPRPMGTIDRFTCRGTNSSWTWQSSTLSSFRPGRGAHRAGGPECAKAPGGLATGGLHRAGGFAPGTDGYFFLGGISTR